MKKSFMIPFLVTLLFFSTSGCGPSQPSNDVQNNGSIVINMDTSSKDAAQGQIIEFISTVSHDIPDNSMVVIRALPDAGAAWNFALCYGIECFISDGSDVIEKEISLSPNSPLELDVKLFAPDQAEAGEFSTVKVEVQSTTSNAVGTASFTATVR